MFAGTNAVYPSHLIISKASGMHKTKINGRYIKMVGDEGTHNGALRYVRANDSAVQLMTNTDGTWQISSVEIGGKNTIFCQSSDSNAKVPIKVFKWLTEGEHGGLDELKDIHFIEVLKTESPISEHAPRNDPSAANYIVVHNAHPTADGLYHKAHDKVNNLPSYEMVQNPDVLLWMGQSPLKWVVSAKTNAGSTDTQDLLCWYGPNYIPKPNPDALHTKSAKQVNSKREQKQTSTVSKDAGFWHTNESSMTTASLGTRPLLPIIVHKPKTLPLNLYTFRVTLRGGGDSDGDVVDLPLVAFAVLTPRVRTKRLFPVGTKVIVHNPHLVSRQAYTATVVVDDGHGAVAHLDNCSEDDADSKVILTQWNHTIARKYHQYQPGDVLDVINAEGDRVTVSVKEQHGVSASTYTVEPETRYDPEDLPGAAFTIDLNAFNHYTPNLSAHSYCEQVLRYQQDAVDSSAEVRDGITGNLLQTKQQLVKIGIMTAGDNKNDALVASPDYQTINDVSDMASLLTSPTRNALRHGQHASLRLLLVADAGSGKTWLTTQLLNLTAGDTTTAPDAAYIPIIVPLQAFAYYKGPNSSAKPLATYDNDFVEWYIDAAFKNNEGARLMLLDAYHSRRLLIVFDGFDEAPGVQGDLVEFISSVLYPTGHRVVLTSRPGIGGHKGTLKMHGFTEFDLKPLTGEQQQAVLMRQVPGEAGAFMTNLIRFQDSQSTMDKEYCDKITKEDRVTLEVVPSIPDDHALIKQVKGILDAELDFGVPEDLSKWVMGEVEVDTQPKKSKKKIKEDEKARGDVTPLSQLTKTLQVSLSGTGPVESAAELLAVAKHAAPVAMAALEGVAKQLKMPVVTSQESLAEARMCALLVAPMKMEARIDEKAKKYKKFPCPCYAWIRDVVRYAFVCKDVAQVSKTLQLLEAHPQMTIIRIKNLFANLDPTHFRRFMCAVRLDFGDGLHHIFEVQVHLSFIFAYKTFNHDLMHGPYAYFRSLFQGGSEKSALMGGSGEDGDDDGWMLGMRKRLNAWAEFLQTPVMMAVLIKALSSLDFTKPSMGDLPIRKPELFAMASSAMCYECAMQLVKEDTMLDTAAAWRKDAKPKKIALPQIETEQGMSRPATVHKGKKVKRGTVRGKGKGKGKQRKNKERARPQTSQSASAPEKSTRPKGLDLEARVANSPADIVAKLLQSALKKAAYHNQFSSGGVGMFGKVALEVRRQYTLKDLLKSIGARGKSAKKGKQEREATRTAESSIVRFLATHHDQANAYRVPTQKILEQGSSTDASSLTMQSVHLSLQELMAVQHIDENPAAFDLVIKGPADALDIIQNAKHKNIRSMYTPKLWRRLGETLGPENEWQLRGKELDCEAVHVLSRVLEHSTKIVKADLSFNKIGSEGGRSIGRALELNRSITDINMEHNDIRLEGSQAIALALAKDDCVISTINLGCNHINLQAAQLLSIALEKNTSLAAADFHNNDFGPDGGKAFAKAIASTSTMKKICLRNTGISSEGTKAVGKALAFNNSITDLDVSENTVGQEGIRAIAEALATNTSLLHLILGTGSGICELEIVDTVQVPIETTDAAAAETKEDAGEAGGEIDAKAEAKDDGEDETVVEYKPVRVIRNLKCENTCQVFILELVPALLRAGRLLSANLYDNKVA